MWTQKRLAPAAGCVNGAVRISQSVWSIERLSECHIKYRKKETDYVPTERKNYLPIVLSEGAGPIS